MHLTPHGNPVGLHDFGPVYSDQLIGNYSVSHAILASAHTHRPCRLNYYTNTKKKDKDYLIQKDPPADCLVFVNPYDGAPTYQIQSAEGGRVKWRLL